MSNKITAFSFGKNWQAFLGKIDETRIENAELSICEFLGCNNLKGKSFADVGCGSGLFSYVAYRLGADRIVSFDVDPFSVQCCRELTKKANEPSNWRVDTGSILDDDYITRLGKFDVVYAWGSLHHTGQMWKAIRNAASLVSTGGRLWIAIYNDAGHRSHFWLSIKKLYNSLPSIGKYFMEWSYILCHTILRNPFKYPKIYKHIKTYKQRRGMSWRTDINDWLGGYPYEFATVEAIFKYMKENFPNFTLLNIKTTNLLGNNQYLFKNTC